MLAKRFNQKGKIVILSETTDTPLTLCGQMAGICYNSDTSNHKHNFKRGFDCLVRGHDRALEYAQVYMILDGWSARVIREFYTHIAGSPTRLQSSTRYIDYSNFEYVVPPSIENDDKALNIYNETMDTISKNLLKLSELNIPKEDSAMLLPLGMTTKVVVRTNLRHLIDMSHNRLCRRAYWEYRKLFKEIIEALKIYSDEWRFLIEEVKVFAPKCEVYGYCNEQKPCGGTLTRYEALEALREKRRRILTKERLNAKNNLLPDEDNIIP